MEPKGIILVAMLNLPVCYLIRRLLFETWGDVWDAIVFWIQPDLLSAFTGEFWEDAVAEFKLSLWVVGTLACFYGEVRLIEKLMGA
jgi:hypothetical protein